MFYSDFVRELTKLTPSSTFLSLQEYKNSSGEISNYSILFNISYKTAVEKSIAMLENYTAEAIDGDVSELKAKAEILAKLYGTLENLNNGQEDQGNYVQFVNAKGTDFIKGIKLHEETNSLYLFGMIVHKKVLVSVDKKEKEKSPKQKLMSMLPVARFRQFRIDPKNVKRIVVQNVTLLPPGALK